MNIDDECDWADLQYRTERGSAGCWSLGRFVHRRCAWTQVDSSIRRYRDSYENTVTRNHDA